MLEYLRNASDRPVAKALMFVLMFSFVGWGVADWIFGGGSVGSSLIKVGGTSITAQQFEQERSRELANMSKDMQKQIYTDPAAQRNFYDQLLSRMTMHAMLLNRANDLGLAVSDKEVANIIRNDATFFENGKFSAMRFNWLLSNAGLSDRMYADTVRAQVLREMVLGGLNASATVPEFAVTAAYNSRYAQREIKFSKVPFSDFKISGNPTDDDLKQIYARNPKMIPETREVSYVLISADLSSPDSYDKAHIRAQKLEDALIGGEAMVSAAKIHNAKYVHHAAFSAAKRPADSVMTDTVISKIFGMGEGLESEIIETKSGFVILRVEKINAEHAADMNSMRAELVAEWKKAQQEKQAYVKANEMLANNLKTESKIVSRASGASVEVLNAAFSMDIGSKTIVPASDAFYVLNIEKEITAKADSAKMTALKKEMQTMQNRGLQDDYMSFLSREYRVKPNKKMFQRLFGSAE